LKVLAKTGGVGQTLYSWLLVLGCS